MRTDLNLVTNTTDGTKKTNKLSYVNPNANNSALSTLAQKVASLSNDTLTAITKTDTTNIPTPAEFTPIRVEFFNVVNPLIFTQKFNEIDNSSIITVCSFNKDKEIEEQELPIMVPNLMPYVKENNTRVQVSIYKIAQKLHYAYAYIGLAVTDSSKPGGSSIPTEEVIPTYTGDIVIGTKTISGNYQNIAQDLIIRIVE